ARCAAARGLQPAPRRAACTSPHPIQVAAGGCRKQLGVPSNPSSRGTIAMHASLALPTAVAAATAAINADDLITGVEDLLSLPDAAIRLNAVLTDPDASVNDIAAIVSVDPALSARVLRAVNSAYFGLRGRVDTITKAIAMIGTSELHSLVLATSAAL